MTQVPLPNGDDAVPLAGTELCQADASAPPSRCLVARCRTDYQAGGIAHQLQGHAELRRRPGAQEEESLICSTDSPGRSWRNSETPTALQTPETLHDAPSRGAS